MGRGANTETTLKPRRAKAVSPIGTPSGEAASRRASRSAAYRAERDRLTGYEQIARIVIKRRMELGLSQQQVAQRMGTSNTAISRIESGQHATKQETLARLADALEMRYVHGFEIAKSKTNSVRQLVSV